MPHLQKLHSPVQAVEHLSAAARAPGPGPHVVLFDVDSVVRNAVADAESHGVNTSSSCITYAPYDAFDMLVGLVVALQHATKLDSLLLSIFMVPLLCNGTATLPCSLLYSCVLMASHLPMGQCQPLYDGGFGFSVALVFCTAEPISSERSYCLVCSALQYARAPTSVCPDTSQFFFLDPLHATSGLHATVAHALATFLTAPGAPAAQLSSDAARP